MIDFNYNGQLIEELKGNINSNFIIDKNENGDITKMYWILTNKDDPYIHEIEYEYDEKGNWIGLFKYIVNPKGEKKINQRVYREII